MAWSRPRYDLDDAATAASALGRDPAGAGGARRGLDRRRRLRAGARPCADRRNGEAVGSLARACAERGIGLVVISTNEVFDGLRTDGTGYAEEDSPAPLNPYGASKLAGERLAAEAFAGAKMPGGAEVPGLWIVRTSWLFGPAGNDFPAQDRRSCRRAARDKPLRVVADEFATPTSTVDLAAAIVALVTRTPGGVHHLVNGGQASRFAWAERVIRGSGRATTLEPICQREFARPSAPPPWGVLATRRASAAGVTARPWEAAVDAYLAASAGDTPNEAAQSASAVASGGLA